MRMRQAAAHPWLVTHKGPVEVIEVYITTSTLLLLPLSSTFAAIITDLSSTDAVFITNISHSTNFAVNYYDLR